MTILAHLTARMQLETQNVSMLLRGSSTLLQFSTHFMKYHIVQDPESYENLDVC
jgi:hypothetical protein